MTDDKLTEIEIIAADWLESLRGEYKPEKGYAKYAFLESMKQNVMLLINSLRLAKERDARWIKFAERHASDIAALTKERDAARAELDAAMRNIARLLAAVEAWEQKAEANGWTP